MRFREYFNSKIVNLCFLGIGVLLFGFCSAIAGLDIRTVFIFAALYVVIVVVWIVCSYLFERRKTEKLEKLVKELDKKYLLGEVLPAPSDFIEQRYYMIIKEISRSAVGAAEQAVREREAYCDYVESWIHEIKTPLTACSLILDNGGDGKKLKAQLKRADNLTESILYYARLRTPENDTQIKKFSVAKEIEEAVRSQMEVLIAAKIGVETYGEFEVYSDPKALCFIIKQLLINCAKYCPKCFVKISANNGVICVEDNGIGIPAHEISRVTQRGFIGTNGRKLGGSTGMGLYIVSELCERLDIDFKIDSVYGEYTRIMLSFRNLTKM